MNSADLVARLRAQAKASCRREEGEDWRDDYRWLAADRIEALEAWKAEAMEVLRRLASEADWLERLFGADADDGRVVPSRMVQFRAARRLVEKEDGR